MKKVVLLLSLFYFYSWAQEYTMTLKFNDGGNLTLPLSTIESLTFDDLTSIEDLKTAQEIINNFTLLQNYPNPFNLSTKISFVLSGKGETELSIYNINGSLVKTLYSGIMSEGTHELIWNGEDESGNIVASGVYFYQLYFENEITTQKMILVK